MCTHEERGSQVFVTSMLLRPLRGAFAVAAASRAPRRLARPLATDSLAVRAAKVSHVEDALKIVHAYAVARYEQSVSVSVVLNVDAKRSDERVQGQVLLPHGTGKDVRVAVFARGELGELARKAGADVVGAEDLVDEVLQGRLDFERVLATPDVMPILARAARTLGPKGLMPNPKRGTVTEDIFDAVRTAKAGQKVFRMNKQGVVHGAIGMVSFDHAILRDNIIAFTCVPRAAKRMLLLSDAPLTQLHVVVLCSLCRSAILAERATRFRNKAPKSIHLSAPPGPGVRLDASLFTS